MTAPAGVGGYAGTVPFENQEYEGAGLMFANPEQDYFEELMDDLYQRMKARAARDPGELGFAEQTESGFEL